MPKADDAEERRVLNKTPFEIAVIVAHERLQYGDYLEHFQGGAIVKLLKKAIFETVREVIVENSEAAKQ